MQNHKLMPIFKVFFMQLVSVVYTEKINKQDYFPPKQEIKIRKQQ